MKKLIAVFLTIATMFSFFILFNTEQSNQKNEMELAEQQFKYNYTILIPTEISNIPQQKVYSKIIDAIEKTNGNIYYTRLVGNQDEQVKYVYTTNFDYFSKFKLKDGRTFNSKDIETDKFLSSKKTNSNNQIGMIATFSGANDFEIHTLKSMVEDGYLLNGYCSVSFNNNDSVNLFTAMLKKSFKMGDFKIIPVQAISQQSVPITVWIVLGIYFIVMLLVLYEILKSYKSIGVEKLMGFSVKSIYIKRILSLLKMQIIIIIPSTLLMMVIMFRDYNQYFWMFLYKLLGIDLIETIVLIAICSLPFLYIRKIKISNMLKNKQPNNEIIIFNIFVKTILLVVFIVSINQGISNFNRVRDVFTNSFKQWDDVANYAVIPNLSNIAYEQTETNGFYEDQKKMYLYFNNQGSILANFSEYTPDTRKQRISETKHDYQRDNVIVNPNYLSKYPIYDTNNKKISISENESAYVVLIPDKYKSVQKNIRDMIQGFKNDDSDAKIVKQPIKIIWTKSNQKLFSMLIDINPNEGNYVIDPIIRVLTNVNGDLTDYDIVMGIDTSPFKIKVNDPLNPSNSIRPVLTEFGYNKYIKNISSVNEQIASESKDVKDMIQQLGLTLFLTGLATLVIILQNVYNYFEKYKQYIAIKQLQGYKMIDIYRSYFIILLFNWILIFISILITKLVNVITLLEISFVLILAEVIITYIALKYISKSKISKVIKGAE